jgi:hypothetical protein
MDGGEIDGGSNALRGSVEHHRHPGPGRRWPGVGHLQNAKLISTPTVQPENLSDQKYPAPTPTYSTCHRSPWMSITKRGYTLL